MMKLYYTPASPFARKVRLVAHELGVESQLSVLRADPWKDESFRRVNPLARIPALELEDGEVLYDSPVLAEYLAAWVGDHRLFPHVGRERWRALKLQALGDGICDAAVRLVVDGRLPKEEQSPAMLERQRQAVAAALEALEGMVNDFPPEPTIGELTVAAALGYLNLRFPDLGWQAKQPRLALWFSGFEKRPSMIATHPDL